MADRPFVAPVRRVEGGYALGFEPEERELLARLLGELRALLVTDGEDHDLLLDRLFPPAYPRRGGRGRVPAPDARGARDGARRLDRHGRRGPRARCHTPAHRESDDGLHAVGQRGAPRAGLDAGHRRRRLRGARGRRPQPPSTSSTATSAGPSNGRSGRCPATEPAARRSSQRTTHFPFR